jgi:hypothetical protein
MIETWLVSYGTCSYIYTHINTVANSVILQLYLRPYVYNTIFNVKHKLYTGSPSASTPPPTPAAVNYVTGCKFLLLIYAGYFVADNLTSKLSVLKRIFLFTNKTQILLEINYD